MSYLIIYDIKRLDSATRLRVNRRLRRLGALKLQHSVWESDDISELKNLVGAIKSSGGNAFITRKRIVAE
jgi:CRISPR-associated endonuclease Cas2